MNEKETDWLRKELRRIHYKWQPRKTAVVNARIMRGKYVCEECKQWYGPKEIAADHIEPVIDPLKSWEGWDKYINRLFSPAENYQVLCKKCHNDKTQEENKIRRDIKK